MDSDAESLLSFLGDNRAPSPTDSEYSHSDGRSSAYSADEALSDSGELSFRDKLRNLFLDLHLEQSKGTAILRLLREHPCFHSLPADHRTLVATPQHPTVLRRVEPGEYLHLGVEREIIDYLLKIDVASVPNQLVLDFSTDGANLDKYGYISMWPIQVRIVNIPNSTPIIVGMYQGAKKPASGNDLFDEFIEETNRIIENGGILFQNTRIPIILRCFIADAPARALVLNHKYPTGHNSCSKCDENGVARTDADYRAQVDEGHHHGPSPLGRLLTFDIVKQVPFDWMHLCLLGAVKRQTLATIKGSFSKDVKLSAREIEIVNARIKTIRDFCPREFARRPKDITNYSRYKATEFRQLILYIGPVIYFGIYKQVVFDHYLLHHAALRCLASPRPSNTDLEYAQDALNEWINLSSDIYGQSFPTYNTHGHKHLAEDVKNLGPLDSISAFIYETHMQILRKLCRSPHLPLQQMYRRFEEERSRPRQRSDSLPQNNELRPSQIHVTGPLPQNWEYPHFVQYKLLSTSQFTLGINVRDNCCILADSSICIIRNVLVSTHDNVSRYYLVVQKFDTAESWFNAGLDSSRIGSFKCRNLNPNLMVIELNNVSGKCYRMPYWPPPAIDNSPPVLPLSDTYIATVMLH